jgi:RimJ/RimL family protein N-acetyltransferase
MNARVIPLEINPLNLSHASVLQKLASHPAISATTRIPYPYPPGQAEKFIRVRMQERRRGQSFTFAIRHNKQVVGVCGLIGVTPDRRAELGYWIGVPYWGSGFASQAVAEVLAISFGTLAMQEVYAKCLSSNAPSRRVLEKNGFRLGSSEAHDIPHWPKEQLMVTYRLPLAGYKGTTGLPPQW